MLTAWNMWSSFSFSFTQLKVELSTWNCLLFWLWEWNLHLNPWIFNVGCKILSPSSNHNVSFDHSTLINSYCCVCFWHRDRVSRPTSVFDRNGFDPFARNRRNSLSKKSKMKQMKQQVAPSIPKQTDFSQVCDTAGKAVEYSDFYPL